MNLVGQEGEANKSFTDRKWLEEFGGLIGMRVSDLTSYSDIEKKTRNIYLSY